MRLLHAGHDYDQLDLLKNNPSPSEDEIRKGIEGNLCRCRYQNIVKSIQWASRDGRDAIVEPSRANQEETNDVSSSIRLRGSRLRSTRRCGCSRRAAGMRRSWPAATACCP